MNDLFGNGDKAEPVVVFRMVSPLIYLRTAIAYIATRLCGE